MIGPTVTGSDETGVTETGAMIGPTATGLDETGVTETGAMIGRTATGLDETGVTKMGAMIGTEFDSPVWVGTDESVGDCGKFETVEIAPVCGIGKERTIGAVIVTDKDCETAEDWRYKGLRAAPRESKTRSSRSSTIKHGDRAATDRARSDEPGARLPQPR